MSCSSRAHVSGKKCIHPAGCRALYTQHNERGGKVGGWRVEAGFTQLVKHGSTEQSDERSKLLWHTPGCSIPHLHIQNCMAPAGTPSHQFPAPLQHEDMHGTWPLIMTCMYHEHPVRVTQVGAMTCMTTYCRANEACRN